MTTATPTVQPFRTRSIEACEAAFARLEAQAGPLHNIFAETGEVLFWLYAISNYGVDEAETLSDGVRWARDNYGHGNLLREIHYTDYGAMLGHFVLGVTRLGAPPVHRWAAVNSLREDGSLGRSPHRLRAYNRDLAGQPVIATLRAEFDRVVAGNDPPTE
jgi:hypothetical protein